MTELLPIIFTRGQNEGIDPRVAPPDVHAMARNVRWRKDGRPAKRYGVVQVTSDGIDVAPRVYSRQPVNAIASWNNTPVLAIGSTVRQLNANGWDNPQPSEIAHFGPGKRQIIARDENNSIDNVTSGTALGLVMHVWQGGADLYYMVTDSAGRSVISPRLLVTNGSQPRAVSTQQFVYVLYKATGSTQLRCLTFTPDFLAITGPTVLGTLFSTACLFDGVGRGTDFAVAYQSAAVTVTARTFTATQAPVQIATVDLSTDGTTPVRPGIAGTSTSSVFVSWLETSGLVIYAALNNATLAVQTEQAIEADTNNDAQPGIVIENNTTAQIVWGGYVAASETSYMRSTRVTTAGPSGDIGIVYNVAPASKPFTGPAFAQIGGSVDGAYVWVATHNANTGTSTKWDTQRAYYLVKFAPLSSPVSNFLTRHLHVANIPPGTNVQKHLSDVLNLGPAGYLTPLLNAVRFGNGLAPSLGVDAVTFHSIFTSVRAAARDTVTAGRALQFSGGSLFELNGAPEETGFSNFPVIQSATTSGAGGIPPNSRFIYRAVYEWLDDEGRRHRSAPSDPVSITTGGSASAITLTLKPLIANSRADKSLGFASPRGVTLHVYRTLGGGSTFHRVTPNVGAPPGFIPGSATVSFTDSTPDTLAGLQEFLYTDGGVADNTLCPSHTFLTVCNARVWAGGQLERHVITASKLLVEGEPTQFSDLEQFSVFLPEENTGLASIDGTVIAFAREKIYLVTGDGPDDQGLGAFNPPSELPTDVGCIDWRSVAETSIGVFFQGKRGIYLLPRGFNTPQFVGLEVESTLAQYPIITSATVVTMQSSGPGALGEVTVRFVCRSGESTDDPGCVLVYDLRTGGWSVDELGQGPIVGGAWRDAFVAVRQPIGVTLWEESPSAGYAAFTGGYLSTELATGDIRPFGVAGYGGFAAVVLVGEFRSPTQVAVNVAVDGNAGDSYVFDVNGPDGPGDDSVYLDVTPKIRLGSAIRVHCFDIGSPGEGFVMQALFIEYDTIGKTKRLAAARRA